ncbi:jumonji domain containing 5 [Arctopsyche grandis]|uniref:jumonji domain containing 5 n=1 Tax=Arctopsyche grandis TaxID=121162 RepID=UPI00406D7BB3
MSLNVQLRGVWRCGGRIPHLTALGPISFVFRQCSSASKNPNIINQKLLLLVESCLDKMQEKLNIGNWKEVPISDRQIITLLSYHRVWIYVALNNTVDENILAKNVLEIIDRGLLFGAPLTPPHDNLLHKCAKIVSSTKTKQKFDKNFKFSSLNTASQCDTAIEYGTVLISENCPSIQTFSEKYMKHKTPVVLKNCIDHWPALTLWDDPSYLIEKIGNRIVPVELGSKYTDSNWTQKLMSVSDFIDNYILDEPSIVGYLAQHQLFQQIPELVPDFCIPDYCCLHEDDTSDNTVDVNAWFGPANTVSPLHTDPKHNLLAQIFGEKLIILLAPEETQYLYCHSGNLLQNTSQVDPIKPDYESHPEFSKAKMYFHILKSSEILYIPPKWWHYVSSRTPSFSVSFWWN